MTDDPQLESPGTLTMSVDRKRRRHRLARWVLRWFGTVVLCWAVLSYFLFLNPSRDMGAPANAIVVLGPSLDGRVQEAEKLADTLHIDQIAISIGDTPGQATADPCVGNYPNFKVTCFVPSPYTTRGEAREIGTLSSQRHWTNVIVIAPRPQISRARLLVKRCYAGKVQMVPSPYDMSWYDWFGAIAYQSGALVKALVNTGC